MVRLVVWTLTPLLGDGRLFHFSRVMKNCSIERIDLSQSTPPAAMSSYYVPEREESDVLWSIGGSYEHCPRNEDT